MQTDKWTTEKIKEWVESQDWYQTIPILDGIVTPGKFDSRERLKLLDLPELMGKTVLDVGCNSGMYCLECKKRNASRVVGIELKENRVEQAKTLAEIAGLNIEIKKMNLFQARELGEFDIVMCFAVLTEVTNVIDALLLLKDITKEVLYLELAVFGANKLDFRFPFRFLGMNELKFLSPLGIAKLRKVNSSWSIAPSKHFLEALMGDKFKIIDLGHSTRYRLLKLVNWNTQSVRGNGK